MRPLDTALIATHGFCTCNQHGLRQPASPSLVQERPIRTAYFKARPCGPASIERLTWDELLPRSRALAEALTPAQGADQDELDVAPGRMADGLQTLGLDECRSAARAPAAGQSRRAHRQRPAEQAKQATVGVQVRSIAARPVRRRGMKPLVEASVFDETGTMRAAFFNQPWLAQRYQARHPACAAWQDDGPRHVQRRPSRNRRGPRGGSRRGRERRAGRDRRALSRDGWCQLDTDPDARPRL